MNFLRYNPGSKPGTRLNIPFKAINEDKCKGIKDGGWLMFLNFSVRCACAADKCFLCEPALRPSRPVSSRQLPVFSFGDTIPNCLMVDLRGKRIGDKIRASEVYLNDGLLLRSTRKDDFAVAKIMGSRCVFLR